MSVLKALVALPFVFALTLLSVPWIALALGFIASGQGGRGEALAERSPIAWWFDRMDGKERL